MSNRTEPEIGSVIESAMSRLSDQAAASAGDAERQRSLGRRDYDQALRERLEQLQQALGERPPAAPPASTVGDGRRFRASTLLVTALLSALGGATASWLALNTTQPPLPAPVRPITEAMVKPPPAPAAPPAPTTPSADDESAWRTRLESWRSAWAGRDSEAYLSHYAADFVPADGQTRSAWAAGRRRNLASRREITLDIRDLQIEPLGADQVKLHFRQDYASSNYRELDQPKTLLLVRREGQWLIAGEWQGAAAQAGR